VSWQQEVFQVDRVYHECTVCSQPLSELDKQMNEKVELLGWPICLVCLDDKTDKVFQILDVDPEDEDF
jgi:hypothetical protein